jgi:hypothetical protein
VPHLASRNLIGEPVAVPTASSSYIAPTSSPPGGPPEVPEQSRGEPLKIYLADVLASEFGTAGFVEHRHRVFVDPPDSGTLADRDRQRFRAMLAIGERLRAACPDSRRVGPGPPSKLSTWPGDDSRWPPVGSPAPWGTRSSKNGGETSEVGAGRLSGIADYACVSPCLEARAWDDMCGSRSLGDPAKHVQTEHRRGSWRYSV